MDDSVWWLLRDTRRVMRRGAASIEQRQRARLRDMVAFARAYSPFYRELYRQVPPGVDDPTLLPATTKGQLMAEFDAWGTDRAVTREAVDAFVDNPALIGERFLDRYTVATTSGTTGTRGVFLIDDAALRVTNVLAARVVGAWLRPRDLPRILARRARMTMVNAAGGHFASTVAAVRLQRRRGNRVQVLPVTTPLPTWSTRSTGSSPHCSPPTPAPPRCWPASRQPAACTSTRCSRCCPPRVCPYPSTTASPGRCGPR
nr:hypothetical protein [Micromonospora provocatoris]